MSTITREEERALLEKNLTQHKRTLAKLELKAAMYSPLERPISLLSEIDVERKEIQNIEEKLQQLDKAIEAQAQKRRQLAGLHSRGMARFHSGHWAQAIHLFQQILDVDRDYKDTSQRLIQAKQQEHLEQLYAGAKQAEADEDWQMVITLCQEIIDIAAFYLDVQWLLWKARLYSMRQRGNKAIANIKTKPAGFPVEEERKPVKRLKRPPRKDVIVTIKIWWTSLESGDKVKIVVALIGLFGVVFSVLFTPFVGRVVDILFPLSTPIPVAIASPTLTATPTGTSTPTHTAMPTITPSQPRIVGFVVTYSNGFTSTIKARDITTVITNQPVFLKPQLSTTTWPENIFCLWNARAQSRGRLSPTDNCTTSYWAPSNTGPDFIIVDVLEGGEQIDWSYMHIQVEPP